MRARHRPEPTPFRAAGSGKNGEDEALRLMAEHQVRRIPVVEEGGRIVGIVAQGDVARQADDRRTGEVVERISQ
jgi:CBS-domain-containing membrane protein